MRNASRLLIGTALAALVSWSVPAAAQSPEPNYQGLWWNSPPESESGWGVNVAHQGDVIFATWFTYDADGKGWWLSVTANRTAEGTYAGTLIETRGPGFNAVPFDPSKVSRDEAGSAIFTFVDADNGTFRYTVRGVQQTKYITRQTFGALPACAAAARPDLEAATNYQDLWWVENGAESGWGINLTHQGDVIFATWFTYESDRTPQWLSVTARRTAPNAFSGDLIRTGGPSFDAKPFDPAKVTRTVAGTASFAFTNGNAATFSYTLDGVPQTKVITRQMFFPPSGTRCGAPYRTVGPFKVVAAGDIADCGSSSPAASGAARTAALVRPDDALVLTLGDQAYEHGSPEDYANCFNPTWGAFKDRIHPAPGNHDYETPGAAGYFGYFGAQAGPGRLGYYSFDHGGWHFISLNGVTDLSPASEQYRWLVSDLAASANSLCTIAVVHYPAFTSGGSYGSILAMRPAFDALQNAGVEIVLSGHEHVYERFAPQRADGTADPARGLRQFVVGTGGRAPNDFGSPIRNSEFRYNDGLGILRLTLGPGSYGWQYLPVGGGAPLDSGTANCHP